MRFFVFLFLSLLSACASLPEVEGFVYSPAESGGFTVPVWLRVRRPGAPLKVWFEGDGFAWRTPTRPSYDPTPRNRVVLKWAKNDAADNVAYIARPCQYVDSAPCRAYYWTDGRFDPAVIDAIDAAFAEVLVLSGAEKADIAGYSGGATVAALVAGRHAEKVRSLTTVAGVIDHAAWTDYFGDSPLTGSLNAADFVKKWGALPQRHFVGGKDETVPPELARRWVPDEKTLSVVPGASHGKGWPDSF